MNNTKQADYVNLEEWDFGDVVTLVENPASYPAPGKGWKLEDVKVATAAATAASLLAGPISHVTFSVIARLLMASAKDQRERRPHVALIAVNDARAYGA